MNRIAKFFHEFLHPHCESCEVEKVETLSCDSCDTLRSQLELANHEKNEILNRLLNREVPLDSERLHVNHVEKPKPRPWPVIRRKMEQADRIKAAALKNAGIPDKIVVDNPKIEELEKEILDNGTGNS